MGQITTPATEALDAAGAKYVFLEAPGAISGEHALEMIKPVELKQLTGYVHGGTSPLGMTNQYRVIFDECAGEMDKVVINGGGGGYLVELALDEFAKVQPYELMPLKK